MNGKNFIRNLFGKPSGNLGHLAGWIMSFNNAQRTAWTVEKLNLNPSDRVLEVGYGPGNTFRACAEKLTSGFIAGIDHSEIMFRQTRMKIKKFIKNGSASLKCGTIWDLDYDDNFFDIIYASNVHFFWETPAREFSRLYLLLKPEGKLVLVYQPRWVKSEEEIRREAEITGKLLESIGFRNIEMEFRNMKPVTCIYIGVQK